MAGARSVFGNDGDAGGTDSAPWKSAKRVQLTKGK
jgi:hypothetical protein